MPARRPATVVLQPEAADDAAVLVRSGEYRSVGDVVSDALVALDERRATAQAGKAVLRDRLRKAVAGLDCGEGVAGAPEKLTGDIFEETLAQAPR